MNSVILIGRLTKDIEVRKVGNDLSTCAFSVAVNRAGKKDQADFINCVAWRQSADFLGQYAHKGDMVAINGNIQTRDYEKNGQKIYVTEVVCDRVELLSKKEAKQEEKKTYFQTEQAEQFTLSPGDLPFY